MVAADQVVGAAFARECYTFDPWNPKLRYLPAHLAHVRKLKPGSPLVTAALRNCVSDEHYVPTVLAVNGLDDEVNYQTC